MKRILLTILMVSQIETAMAKDLVAPPSSAVQFEEAPPAQAPRKMKPASATGSSNITPMNTPAPAAAMGSAKSQTVMPAPVAMQQPLPAQQAQTGPVQIPAQPIPNVSAQQNPGQAMSMIQQVMQLLTGQQGAPPKYLPNGEVNPAYSNYIGGQPSNQYDGSYGLQNHDQTYPGLEQSKLLSQGEAVSRLKNYNCGNKNDKDRLTCMVCNLMFEAGNQPREGQLAVVQSVMTRAFSGHYPDTVCKVVYQHKQYSWVYEKKDHRLPGSPQLDRLVEVAMEGMKKGPNGYSNYFAPGLLPAGKPDWGYQGECAATKTRLIGAHQFCKINAVRTRSVSDYLRAEGLDPGSAATEAPFIAK